MCDSTKPSCNFFSYVWLRQRTWKSGFFRAMKSWLHCFQKRTNEIADEEEVDDLESSMSFKSKYVGIRNWKMWEKRRLQAERGSAC